MAYQGLGDFISTLERAGELKRIVKPVSAELEITEITDRVSKAGGPALLFEKVEGHSAPLLINAFGSNGSAVAARSPRTRPSGRWKLITRPPAAAPVRCRKLRRETFVLAVIGHLPALPGPRPA